MCGQHELPDLERYARRMTDCMETSQYPKQVSASVGRFLWFTNPGKPIDVWSNFFDVQLVDKWYDRQLAKGMKPSSLYNMLSCLLHASDYCFSCLGESPPNGFNRHLKKLRRKQSKRRKVTNQATLEEQGLNGIPDLRPFVTLLKRQEMVDQFIVIFDKCNDILEGRKHVALRKPDYLFAMRLTLSFVMVSMALRTSAAYTLTIAQLDKPLGDWDGGSPILFRNNCHKTAATSGHARVVVSGLGKSLLSMFVSTIRSVFIASHGLRPTPYVFADSAGKQLTASAISKHMLCLHGPGRLHIAHTPTHIRKCICSQIKGHEGDAAAGQIASAVAAGLLHTVATSTKHYTVGSRDSIALELHRAIITFYDL